MRRYNAYDFGENLKEIRKKKYYSQKELAKATLIDQGTISRMEQGKVFPNIELLVIIANELNTTVGALLKNRDLQREKEKQKKYDEECELDNIK